MRGPLAKVVFFNNSTAIIIAEIFIYIK